MENRKRIRLFAIGLLAFVGIGYAVLHTNLGINTNFSFGKNRWDIYFDNVVVDVNSIEAITAPTISTNKSTINYAINFKKPGDYYSFTVDVVNNGTLDSYITLVNSLEGIEQNYLEYSVTYLDGDDIEENNFLAKHTKDTFKVSVRFKTNIDIADLPTSNTNMSLTLSLEYSMAKGGEQNLTRQNKTIPFVKDLSSSGKDGIMYNGAVLNYDTSSLGGTAQLDGVDDYINTNLKYDYEDSITLAAYIRTSQLVADSVVVGDDSAGIYLSSSNKFVFYVKTEDGNIEVESDYVVVTPSRPNDTWLYWYAVIGTYDGTTAKIYVKPYTNYSTYTINQNSITGNLLPSNTAMVIGGKLSNLGVISNNFNMNITELFIYNRALTSSELTDDWVDWDENGEFDPANKTGLILHYNFND